MLRNQLRSLAWNYGSFVLLWSAGCTVEATIPPQTDSGVPTRPDSSGPSETSEAGAGGARVGEAAGTGGARAEASAETGDVHAGYAGASAGTGGANAGHAGASVGTGGANAGHAGAGAGTGGANAGHAEAGGGTGGAHTGHAGAGAGTGGSGTGGVLTGDAQPSCGDASCGLGQTCTNPVFVTSDKHEDQTFPNGYTVFNNVWAGNGGPQTMNACSPSNWYVVSNQPVISNSRGEIKSYPCSKWDFGGKALDEFTSITSSFGSSAPAEGVWNAAYDIWLGPEGWDIEVMVWTDYRYLATLPPGGAESTDAPTLDGIEYYAWTYPGHEYIGLAMKQPKTSGTLEFRHIFDWIVSKGWMPVDSRLHWFEYGIEIAETNGKDLTFAVTDFSVTGE